MGENVQSIGALIVSAGEPQLERCLHAVNNQTIPFSHIVHINNIVPESVAFNTGIEASTDEWIMKIDGDMILYSNAVEIALFNMSSENNIYAYSYGLFDEFLQTPICGCNVLSRSAFQLVKYQNVLANDIYTGRKLRRLGFIRKALDKQGILIGTHCPNPDEFQIFRRFYSNGVKHGKRFFGRHLHRLYQETGNILYKFAFESLMFGTVERSYPTSHNLDFDRQMFEKFKEEHENNYKSNS